MIMRGFGEQEGHSGEGNCTNNGARLSEKILGPAGPQIFIFCRQNKYSGRQKCINGFSFVKDNGLLLVYVFPKKKVTYLGGQVGDQA